jgi:hypothetical protein
VFTLVFDGRVFRLVMRSEHVKVHAKAGTEMTGSHTLRQEVALEVSDRLKSW